MNTIVIRSYTPEDYQLLKRLYKSSGWFDSETDAEERVNEKIRRDPQSLLVAIDKEEIVGTVSLIEDGRIAILFRLISKKGENTLSIRQRLLSEGENIFKQKGYKEAHIIAPEEDLNRQKEYEKYGFTKGNPYRWMWKKIETNKV
jgi:ribosomal protein S18 acetylase RimI-like enzyme